MDFLKRTIAPIPQEAWEELDEEATKVLKNALSGRKVVDFTGPKGWNYDALSEGTLDLVDGTPVDGVYYGTRKVTPMTEIRVPFKMPIWALDDIARGNKTVDHAPVQEAARKAAMFEDMAIYYGIEQAQMIGLLSDTDNKPLDMKLDDDAIVETLTKAIQVLKDANVDGPYALVAPYALWTKIESSAKGGYPLKKRVNKVVEKYVLSSQIDACFLISLRGGDNELVIGQDFSIGYQSTEGSDVNLYITETLTFKNYSPETTVAFKLKK